MSFVAAAKVLPPPQLEGTSGTAVMPRIPLVERAAIDAARVTAAQQPINSVAVRSFSAADLKTLAEQGGPSFTLIVPKPS